VSGSQNRASRSLRRLPTVSEQGRQVGTPTPFSDEVVELITRVPPGTLKPDPKNLEPLVAMLPK